MQTDYKLIVTCSSHMQRGCAGMLFQPGASVFAPTHFDEAQLRAILADRFLSVVVGHEVKSENVDEFVEWAQRWYPKDEPQAGASSIGGATSVAGGALVSGLAVYPAGGQAAVLPAAGGPLVDPASAGAVRQPAPIVPPVVVPADGASVAAAASVAASLPGAVSVPGAGAAVHDKPTKQPKVAKVAAAKRGKTAAHGKHAKAADEQKITLPAAGSITET